jgi:hypothetical protein
MKINCYHDRLPNPELQTTGATYRWRDAGDVCTLNDGDRCCGLVVNTGIEWHAFDATRIGCGENRLVFLGARRHAHAAKRLTLSTILKTPAILKTRGTASGKAEKVPVPFETLSEVKRGFPTRSKDPLSPYLLNYAGFDIETAIRRGDWALATRLIRALVAKIRKIGLSASEPQRWSRLENIARDIGATVIRRDEDDRRILFERYENELCQLLEGSPTVR